MLKTLFIHESLNRSLFSMHVHANPLKSPGDQWLTVLVSLPHVPVLLCTNNTRQEMDQNYIFSIIKMSSNYTTDNVYLRAVLHSRAFCKNYIQWNIIEFKRILILTSHWFNNGAKAHVKIVVFGLGSHRVPRQRPASFENTWNHGDTEHAMMSFHGIF